MADPRPDALTRAQQETIGRLVDAARTLAELPPVASAGRRAEEALSPMLSFVQAMAGYGALAVEPLADLVDAQRELADRMAEWAELQRQFAENMAAWADLQRRLADTLGLILGPMAEGGHRVADVLNAAAGKPHHKS